MVLSCVQWLLDCMLRNEWSSDWGRIVAKRAKTRVCTVAGSFTFTSGSTGTQATVENPLSTQHQASFSVLRIFHLSLFLIVQMAPASFSQQDDKWGFAVTVIQMIWNNLMAGKWGKIPQTQELVTVVEDKGNRKIGEFKKLRPKNLKILKWQNDSKQQIFPPNNMVINNLTTFPSNLY